MDTTPVTLTLSATAASALDSLDEWRRQSCVEVINRWLESEARDVAEIAQRLAQVRNVAPQWAITVPLNPNDPDGPSVRGLIEFDPVQTWYVDEHGLRAVAPPLSFSDNDESRVSWLEEVGLLLVRVDQDRRMLHIVRALPMDTDLAREYRCPQWIQSPEAPECCGAKMYFVGQLDDDELCVQRPKGALLWWHDTASFYVFTCGICLGVKAVGQQF